MAQIKTESQIGGEILYLKGQFTGGNETDNLRDTLKKLTMSDTKNIIIDLEDTTYLNSTALGVLISAHSSFVKKDGKLILANVSKSLENIFVITKLTMVFEIEDTLDDAISKLSKS